jgi:hypothetical protein
MYEKLKHKPRNKLNQIQFIKSGKFLNISAQLSENFITKGYKPNTLKQMLHGPY